MKTTAKRHDIHTYRAAVKNTAIITAEITTRNSTKIYDRNNMKFIV